MTAAPEAIALATRCGQPPDEWQANILGPGMGIGPDGDWTAKKIGVWAPRQNGKGGIIETLELDWLFNEQVELIVHSAHEQRTSMRAFKRLEKLIRRTPFLLDRMKRNRNQGFRESHGEQGIELADGRELLYTTRSNRAVRGFSAARLILDEAQELTAEQMAAILPTLSAMPLWQCWFFGTPPTDATAWCYGLRDDGEAGTPRLGWADWGADLDLDDPADMARAFTDVDLRYATNPQLGYRIAPSTVEDEAKPSGLGNKFPIERLGVWPKRADAGRRAITPERWASLASTVERPAEVVFSIEVDPDRSGAAIVACGWLPDGRALVSIVDSRPGTGWIPGRAAILRERWDPLCWVVDERSPAAALVRPLADKGIVVPERGEFPRGHLATMGTRAVADAWAGFVDAANADPADLAHLDEPELSAALGGAAVRSLAGGSAWARTGTSIRTLVAATQAHWGLVVLGPVITPVTDDFDVLESVY